MPRVLNHKYASALLALFLITTTPGCGNSSSSAPASAPSSGPPASAFIQCTGSATSLSCGPVVSQAFGFDNPFGIAENPVDHTIWVANLGATDTGQTVSVLTPSPTGPPTVSVLSDPSYKFYGPIQIAFDPEGTAWITSTGSAPAVSTWPVGNVTEIPSGSTSPTVFSGSVDYPLGIAVDSGGNVWVASAGLDDMSGNAVTEFVKSSGYTPVIYCRQSGFKTCPSGSVSVPGLGYPVFHLQPDKSGNVFVVAGYQVGSFTPNGSGGMSYNSPSSSEATNLGTFTLDPAGNLWVVPTSTVTCMGCGGGPDPTMSVMYEFVGQDTQPQTPGYGLSNRDAPSATQGVIQSDGAGNIWYLSTAGSVLVELSASNNYAATVYCDPATLNSFENLSGFWPGSCISGFRVQLPCRRAHRFVRQCVGNKRRWRQRDWGQ